MKTVLLIAFFYPPMTNIGAQRPYRIAKYLPACAWTPIVLTVKQARQTPLGISTVQTDYRDVVGLLKRAAGFNATAGLHEQLGLVVPKQFAYRGWKGKIIRSAKDLIAYPDEQKGWRSYAVRAAVELLRTTQVDAIVSTSAPVTCHLIAARLKRIVRIPWVADLRDLWTQNHYYDKGAVIKWCERRLERATLAGADALVTANPQVDELRQLHNHQVIVWIPNGYDPCEFVGARQRVQEKFTVTYSGTLYNGKRDPTVLFSAVRNLIRQNRVARDRIDIRFYGARDAWLEEDIARYGLQGVARGCGVIPRAEVLKRQRESHVLLLLLWNHEKEANICPGKVYEYLGARRPIVAVGGSGGAVKRLLEATNGGRMAEDEGALQDIIASYYDEFVKTGDVRSLSNDKVAEYEYGNVARQYADLLEKVTLTAAGTRHGSRS